MTRKCKASKARSARVAASQTPEEPLRFFVLPSQYITGTERTHAVFLLPHPKTGEAALYMKTDTGEYLEMVKFREKQGSWMVNGGVEQDGSLYMAAPLDPLYLVVTLLRQAVGLEPWEDLVDFYPELLGVLNSCKGRLPQICDVVEDYMTTAFSIISDYVPAVLGCALRSSLGLDAEPAAEGPGSLGVAAPTNKVPKGDRVEQRTPKGQAAASQAQPTAKRGTTKRRQRKADKAEGISSITSFFAHK
ncbi:uncharacterized protein LOC144179421 isoform X4 [Haemaphysalis longicornis]